MYSHLNYAIYGVKRAFTLKEKGKKKKPEKSKARQVIENEKQDENQGKDAEEDVKDAVKGADACKDAAKNQKNKVPRSLAQLEVRVMIGLKLFLEKM